MSFLRKLRFRKGGLFRWRWPYLLLAIAGALLFVAVGRVPAIAQANATVVVDFAAAQPEVKSMSGFLHSVEQNEPPDGQIQPLAPKLWRMGRFDLYPRLTGFGATYQLVLSDTWGYGTQRGWPFNDYSGWEERVRTLAQRHKGKNIAWDIWNEPDLRDPFWKGSREQFFETYKRAYRILREELGPDAAIGGPSISKYDKGFLTAFLNYARSNNLEVNFLSWHELNDQEITAIASHIQDARRSFQQNPAFRSVNIKQLHVNEIVGPTAQYRPAENLGYLYYTEQGGADAAAKACWEAKGGGQSNCWNNSLDGLLQPSSFASRAVWWVYKSYAEGVGSRVRSQTTNPKIVALASRSNAQNRAQVLFGYFEQGRSSPRGSMTLVLQNLGQLDFVKPGESLTFAISRVPDRGEAPVKEPTKLTQEQIAVSNETVRLTIPNLKLHEAYLLTIS